MHPLVLAAAGFGAAAVGTVGGLGGAVLLVPALVVAGMAPAAAVPLGMLTVGAGSLAAAASQIDEGLVNHRLGITIEAAASAGAVGGAFLTGLLSEFVLTMILAAVAVIAAGASLIPTRSDGRVDPETVSATPGEWPGTIGGAYAEPHGLSGYRASRLGPGLASMLLTGVVAGLSGTSGGYLKTPLQSLVMGIPAKVAGATTTFTVGVTAASALLVHLSDIDVGQGAGVVLGAIAGGWVGSVVQRQLPERVVAIFLSCVLVAVAVVLVVTA